MRRVRNHGIEVIRAVCDWSEDDLGVWTTECGVETTLSRDCPAVYDLPIELGYKFCPYCSGRIRALPHIETSEGPK